MQTRASNDTMTPGRRSVSRRPDLVPRIESWLRDRVGRGAAVRVVPREVDGGGFSSELFFVDVDGGVRDDAPASGEYVLRLERVEDALFPSADFSIEYRLQRALGTTGAVPVPAIPWVEEDPSILGGRCYVMERIRGDVLPHFNDSGWVARASAAQRAQLWRSGIDALAALHAIDVRQAGLESIGESDLRADLDSWRRLYERDSERAFPALLGAAFERLEGEIPKDEQRSVCWGDARHQNMVFRGFECVAMLDWEMATQGEPEKDLAFLLTACRTVEEAGIERLSGYPSRAESVEIYEAASGRRLRHLAYYEGFSLLRMLVIQTRFMKLGLMPSGSAIEDNPVARLLERFLND